MRRNISDHLPRRAFVLVFVSMLCLGHLVASLYRGVDDDSTPFNAIGKVSDGLVSKTPINILGDAELNAFCSGNSTNGSASNPHVIANFYVDASGSNYGIKISNTTLHLIIENNRLEGNSFPFGSLFASAGIILNFAENVTVRSNTCVNNYNGLAIQSCINISIRNNIFDHSIASGLFFNASLQVAVLENHFLSCGVVLLGSLAECLSTSIDGSNDVNVVGRVVFLKNWNGPVNFSIPIGSQLILVNCSNVQIQSFSFEHSSTGVAILHSSDLLIANSTFFGQSIYNCVAYSSRNVSIVSNDMAGALYSIGLLKSENCSIVDNTIHDAYLDGIVTSSGNRIRVVNNIFENITYYGVKFVDSNNTHVAQNDVIGCNVGIGLAWDDVNASIENNVVTAILSRGIDVDFSRNISITGNTVSNGVVGLRINMDVDGASVYLNNFINNSMSHAVVDSGSNVTWNSSAWGNYWDNYTSRYPGATQANGTWQTPYELPDAPFADAKYIDFHPLVEQSRVFPDGLPAGHIVSSLPRITTGVPCDFQFIGYPGNSPLLVTWYIDDAAVSHYGLHTQIIFHAAGRYNISISITDIDGDVYTSFEIVDVENPIDLGPILFIVACTLSIAGVLIFIKKRKPTRY